jgi:UDP-N-acetylmuramoyl-tripeptide--D-alanyl-D-alanine ligase
VGGDLGLAGLALGEMPGLPGRGARVRVPVGDGAALVIDESYNANPASMRATLAVLAQEKGRRLAVLGDMRELGDASAGYHAALAEPIAETQLSFAILVGPEMAALAQALEGTVDFVHVPDAAAARDRLIAALAPGDAVLVKGSNAIGLSAIVAALGAQEGTRVGAAG